MPGNLKGDIKFELTTSSKTKLKIASTGIKVKFSEQLGGILGFLPNVEYFDAENVSMRRVNPFYHFEYMLLNVPGLCENSVVNSTVSPILQSIATRPDQGGDSYRISLTFTELHFVPLRVSKLNSFEFQF